MAEELDNFETKKKPSQHLVFKVAIAVYVISVLFRIQHYPGAYIMNLISTGLLFGFVLFAVIKSKNYNVTLLIASVISFIKLADYAQYLINGWRFPEVPFAFFLSIACGTFVWLKS